MNSVKQWRERLNNYFRADIYRRLLPYMRPYKIPMGIVIALTLLQSGLALLEPWPMKLIVDSGLGDENLPDWLKEVVPFLRSESGHAIIAFSVGVMIALRLIGNALDIYGGYLKTRVNEGMILDFKSDMFNHLQKLSFSYHDRTTVGDSMHRLNNDTGFVSTLVWGNFRHLLTSLLSFFGILFIVIQLDWQLAAIALAASPILYASVALYGKYFKDKSKRVKGLESQPQTIMQEVLSCLRVVKAFGMEEREQKRFEESSWSALRARFR